MSVIDISNHNVDRAAAAGMSIEDLMRCYKRHGVERIIVNAWNLDISTQLIRWARRMGIAAEDCYAFIYYGLAHERREVDNAKLLATVEGLRCVWLDCEAAPDGWVPTESKDMTVGYRLSQTAKYRAELIQEQKVATGIYTGYFWWREKMGNTTIFADAGDPLWYASYYDDHRAVEELGEREFGGWKRASIHQYSSTIQLCGGDTDHNHWFIGKDEPMTPEEKAAFKALEDKVKRLERVQSYGHFPVVVGPSTRAALTKVLGAASVPADGELVRLAGEQPIAFFDAQGSNIWLGLLHTQDAIAQLAVSVGLLAQQSVGNFDDVAAVARILEDEYMDLAEGLAKLRQAAEAKEGVTP